MYAMTVHRSQGSQFDAVTVVLPDSTSPLATKALLYTAVTRAMTSLHVFGSPDGVAVALSREAKRASGLADRLT